MDAPEAAETAAEAEETETPEAVAEGGEDAAPEEDPVDEAEAARLDDEAIFEQALGKDIRVFKENEMVEGTVVSVDIEGALVDIGFKSEALIPANELSIKKNVDPRDVVSVGELVEGVVLTREDENGRPILSKKRAQYKRAWSKVEEVHRDDKSVKGNRHRSGEGRPDRGHRPAGFPSGLPGGSAQGVQPSSVRRHRDRGQGHRVGPPAQQRGALPARLPGGGAGRGEGTPS